MKPKSGPTIVSALSLAAVLAAVFSHAQGEWMSSRITSGGKDLNAVYFTDTKRGWVAGVEGFLASTDDGGANWIERPLGVNHAINDVYFVNKDDGFVLAGGTIFESADAGHTWRESHKFSATDFDRATPELYRFRFNGKRRGWVVGSTSRGENITGSILSIPRDGGANWQDLHPPTQQELIHIDFVDEKHGWIVGAAGAILHTDDAGETWIRQRSDTTVT